MTTTEVPTLEAIEAQWELARNLLNGLTMVGQYTLDDYPIGGHDRGLCRLEVECDKRKGFRTVRTTTDNRGRWCKPKKSVYQDNGAIAVPPIVCIMQTCTVTRCLTMAPTERTRR